ncbi:MAG: toprim domain-containing protein, partial [Chloroflexi bacterium]|nr:toprim domain-containing protein [Chloroflexota bacterium]
IYYTNMISWPLERITQQMQDLQRAGLIVKGEEGYYDLFRGRLIFPIRNTEGKVIGFGGRILNQEGPKYINSPQTAVFNKSDVLYGIERSAAAIRRSNMVVIVEGYMAVITAHQYGIENVVASTGTALTERQITI